MHFVNRWDYGVQDCDAAAAPWLMSRVPLHAGCPDVEASITEALSKLSRRDLSTQIPKRRDAQLQPM
jgi:hypothetical protein